MVTTTVSFPLFNVIEAREGKGKGGEEEGIEEGEEEGEEVVVEYVVKYYVCARPECRFRTQSKEEAKKHEEESRYDRKKRGRGMGIHYCEEQYIIHNRSPRLFLALTPTARAMEG